MRSDEMIAVEGLHKEYGHRVALEEVSFDVPKGEIFGFIGPNGAGKTTTIRILATLSSADAGEATIGGIPVHESPAEVRNLIGYMPDFFGVFDRLTSEEYLEFYAACHGGAAKAAGGRPRAARAGGPLRPPRRGRRQPQPGHEAAPRPGPGAGPRSLGPAPRRARLGPRPAGARRDEGADPGAAADGQDHPDLQPHPPRARGALHLGQLHRRRPDGRRRAHERGPRRGRRRPPAADRPRRERGGGAGAGGRDPPRPARRGRCRAAAG